MNTFDESTSRRADIAGPVFVVRFRLLFLLLTLHLFFPPFLQSDEQFWRRSSTSARTWRHTFLGLPYVRFLGWLSVYFLCVCVCVCVCVCLCLCVYVPVCGVDSISCTSLFTLLFRLLRLVVCDQHVPSSAFTLLYRLFELDLSKSQITAMLADTRSPYVRAVGCLYLR